MTEWFHYLTDFHSRRPGITEDVLALSFDRGQNPYDWLVGAVPPPGLVLDLACGNGPLWAALNGRGWVGTDVSEGELRLARRRGELPVVVADATAQPLQQGCAAVVVCSMALMLVQPLDAALAEITRLLVPGGTLIALLPASRPLTSADAVRYGHLLFALRSWRLRYPNDSKLANLRAMLSRASLTLIAEERRRFSYAVTSPGMGLRFVQSLYLPGQSPQRLQAAAKVAERWVGKELGLPLRRILAVRQ